MKKSTLVLACTLLMVAALLFTSCSPAAPTGDSGAPQDISDVSIATIALYAIPMLNWDIAIANSNEIYITNNVYERLLRFDPETNEFMYDLATAYEASADGLTWTFTLREGVKFHDGTDFNAEAVKFSIERTMRLGKGASYIWDEVSAINVIDDYTVEFKLANPVPLDLIAASNIGAFIYSPTAVGDDDEASSAWFSEGNMCGTGPYMLQSQTPGNEVILTTFPEYWKGWEGEHIDKLVFSLVTENATRRQMVERGEADAVLNILPEDVVELEKNENVNVVVADSFKSLGVWINTVKAPLDNVALRQALSYAVPYESYVEFVRLGRFADTPTDVMMNNAMWGSLQEPAYTFDLDKAAELLVEAGYPGGEGLRELEISNMAGTDDRKKMLELWKAELAKIGVTLNITDVPWDSMVEIANQSDKTQAQDLLCMGQWPDLPTPQAYYLGYYKTGATWNWSYYSNPEIDTGCEEAYILSATDRAAAQAEYERMAAIIAADAPTINLGDDKTVMVLSKALQGYEANAAYDLVIFFYDCYKA